jgi:uncharacterized integral membrane protein
MKVKTKKILYWLTWAAIIIMAILLIFAIINKI